MDELYRHLCSKVGLKFVESRDGGFIAWDFRGRLHVFSEEMATELKNAASMTRCKRLRLALENKERELKQSIERSKIFAESLPVCKYCGDRAIDIMMCCQDCQDEIFGKSNGMKHLGGKGHPQTWMFPSSDNAGSNKKHGRFGIGGNLWDNVVMCLEEDR